MYYRKILLILFLFCSVPVNAQGKSIMILGDSLSAAYGIPVESGWVSLLKQRLLRQDYAFKVVNASISGETTLGARTRLNQLLETNRPDIVIVELGGNDGLRGFALSEVEHNLKQIVMDIKQHGSQVLLVPMQLPPNYGETYNKRFYEIYERIAGEMEINLSNFILDDIAEHAELMQADGIHPVASAQVQMLENIWPGLLSVINPQLVRE